MSLSRGKRRHTKNSNLRAWIHCLTARTFCFCMTIRTGASFIGWFNFIFNSLYVGMLVFALARTSEKADKAIELINRASIDISHEGSGQEQSVALSKVLADYPFFKGCEHSSNINDCICIAESVFIVNSSRDCSYLPSNYQPSNCLCSYGYIAFKILPMMYKSIAIPGVMVVFSILWLTAVESRSIRFVRLVGYSYILAIPCQLILQVYYLVYAGREFEKAHVGGVHPVVWLVFVVYALLNLYYLRVLFKYIKLRRREFAQGIEQGLLTSERFPPTNQGLDVYLEDAFAITSDAEEDHFRYSTTQMENDINNQDTTNIVEYDYNALHHESLAASDVMDEDNPPEVTSS